MFSLCAAVLRNGPVHFLAHYGLLGALPCTCLGVNTVSMQ